jgi:hypothetical protein
MGGPSPEEIVKARASHKAAQARAQKAAAEKARKARAAAHARKAAARRAAQARAQRQATSSANAGSFGVNNGASFSNAPFADPFGSFGQNQPKQPR